MYSIPAGIRSFLWIPVPFQRIPVDSGGILTFLHREVLPAWTTSSISVKIRLQRWKLAIIIEALYSVRKWNVPIRNLHKTLTRAWEGGWGKARWESFWPMTKYSSILVDYGQNWSVHKMLLLCSYRHFPAFRLLLNLRK